jgi:hypothetical protein
MIAHTSEGYLQQSPWEAGSGLPSHVTRNEWFLYISSEQVPGSGCGRFSGIKVDSGDLQGILWAEGSSKSSSRRTVWPHDLIRCFMAKPLKKHEDGRRKTNTMLVMVTGLRAGAHWPAVHCGSVSKSYSPHMPLPQPPKLGVIVWGLRPQALDSDQPDHKPSSSGRPITSWTPNQWQLERSQELGHIQVRAAVSFLFYWKQDLSLDQSKTRSLSL